MPGKPEVEGGFVLLARRILESDVWQGPPLHLKLFLWMLLKARHRDGSSLKRGQLIARIEDMQEAMAHKVGYRKQRPTREAVRSAYEAHRRAGTITTTKTTRGMRITILNYDRFQDPKRYEARNEAHRDERTKAQHTPQDIQECKEEKITASLRSRTSSPSQGRKKKVSPDVSRFLHWWSTEYQERTCAPYHLNGGKEGALVKRMLATYGYDRLEAMARAFLRSEDQFIIKAGRTIGVLSSQANRLAADSASRPEPTIIPSEEFLRGNYAASS
jgi:hypothetical protein